MSKDIHKLLCDASFAIDLCSGDAFKIILGKEGKYKIIDNYAATCPAEIFNGSYDECIAFLKGVKWGAKAGRSAMADQF